MKLTKCKRLHKKGEKTATYVAVFKDKEDQSLRVRFIYSKTTKALIPLEILLNGIKYGCRLRKALDAIDIKEKTVPFLNRTKLIIDKHYSMKKTVQ